MLGVAGGVHAAVMVLALLVLVANIQGAVAPLSSALGLMPLSNPDPALAGTLVQVRDALATGEQPVALDARVQDYARYHLTLAVVATGVTLTLLAVAVRLWRQRARLAPSERRYRRVLLTGAISMLLLTAFFAIITAANLTTVAHPAPALLGFFNGGLQPQLAHTASRRLSQGPGRAAARTVSRAGPRGGVSAPRNELLVDQARPRPSDPRVDLVPDLDVAFMQV